MLFTKFFIIGAPMSDHDALFREMLERITKKIESSPALNGGFDKLMVVVEHIKERQDETGDKVDKIHDGLYEPDSGLYARVKSLESTTENMSERYIEHIENDEHELSNITMNLKNIYESASRADEIALKVKKIAGEDLEKLQSIVKTRSFVREIVSKGFWLLGAGILGAIGKTAWEILSK